MGSTDRSLLAARGRSSWLAGWLLVWLGVRRAALRCLLSVVVVVVVDVVRAVSVCKDPPSTVVVVGDECVVPSPPRLRNPKPKPQSSRHARAHALCAWGCAPLIRHTPFCAPSNQMICPDRLDASESLFTPPPAIQYRKAILLGACDSHKPNDAHARAGSPPSKQHQQAETRFHSSSRPSCVVVISHGLAAGGARRSGGKAEQEHGGGGQGRHQGSVALDSRVRGQGGDPRRQIASAFGCVSPTRAPKPTHQQQQQQQQ